MSLTWSAQASCNGCLLCNPVLALAEGGCISVCPYVVIVCFAAELAQEVGPHLDSPVDGVDVGKETVGVLEETSALRTEHSHFAATPENCAQVGLAQAQTSFILLRLKK